MRTRHQQKAKNPLTPLALEEAKARENNVAHIKHLREAMKDGIDSGL